MGNDYEGFCKKVYKLTNIDLSQYKEKQMKRRIDTLISKKKADGYDGFVDLISKDKEAYDEFVSYLTINVSEFYRNPDQWEYMDKVVIPELLKKFGKNLKIWSAACSTGDEPYSLVMALSRHLPLNQIHIDATDIDKEIIAKAKLGLYSAKSVAGVPEDLKKKYFDIVGSSYKIKDEIKSRVTFKQHNLLTNDYPSGYHMIVCRNVLIYFTEEAKDEVYRKFNKALVMNGSLFIGSTEQIVDYKAAGYTRTNSFFYEKIN